MSKSKTAKIENIDKQMAQLAEQKKRKQEEAQKQYTETA